MDAAGMDSGMDSSSGNSTAPIFMSTGSSSMSGMSGGNGACSSMFNGYHFSLGTADDCVLFLFPFSQVNTHGKYAAAVIGSFALSAMLELVIVGRGRLIEGKAPFGFLKNQSDITIDLIRTVSYVLQAWIGYWIMLLVMSYEAMIFIAIMFGLGTGYFCALRVTRSLDRLDKQQPKDVCNKNSKTLHSATHDMDSDEGAA